MPPISAAHTQQIKQDARPAVLGSDHRAVPRHYLRVITTVGRAPDPGTSFMQSAAERMRAAERRDIGIVGRHQQHRGKSTAKPYQSIPVIAQR